MAVLTQVEFETLCPACGEDLKLYVGCSATYKDDEVIIKWDTSAAARELESHLEFCGGR